jgi:hypothetical protein
MNYVRKKRPVPSLNEKTFTEIEEEQYQSFKSIDIGNKGALLLVAAFLGMLLFSSFSHAIEVQEIYAEDGAGSYWTCSYCGYSNKCYEIWCANCGR